MNNNLFLDINKKVKIKKNKKNYFKIEKFKYWKYCIIVNLKLSEEIDYINLYFIIKSYVYFKKIQPCAICTLFEKNKEFIITQKSVINWFVSMDFEMFKDWLDFRIKNDLKYEDNSEFFGIIIVYPKEIIELEKEKEDILNFLKPKHPWSDEWMEGFKNEINTIEMLKKKIEQLENRLKNKHVLIWKS